MTCARAAFLRTPSHITRHKPQETARPFSSTAEQSPIRKHEKETNMTPQEMRVLYDYNAWANHRSVDAASSLTMAEFAQTLGSSVGSVPDVSGGFFGCQ